MLAMFIAGFSAIFTFKVIMLMVLGVGIGIIFGAIPGLTAAMAVALMLPITFGLDAISGFALLIALYIGGISGGLISAILINIPGTPSSIATTFDGAPMAKKGEGGKALGVGVFYSFLGTLFSIAILIFVAPPLADVALKFGAYEYFSLAVFALTLIAGLAGKSMLKGLMSGFVGMALASIGVAPIDGFPRFTFGIPAFDSGFALLPALVGLYAISEVLKSAESKFSVSEITAVKPIKGLGFSWREFKEQLGNFFRSSLIGTGIGILPGIGGSTSNILAYIAAKRFSKHPEKFGTGIMDGVVASESSNNASVGGAMVPLLTLGIPGDGVTAILLGGFLIQGLTPGPLLFVNNGDFVYAIFAALIVASFIMLVMEFFGMRLFIKLLKIPKNILLPIVLVLSAVGGYASNNTMFGVWTLFIFGLIGYFLDKFGYPLPPIILGFILGPIAEENLRRGLQLSQGSFMPFLTHPISLVFLLAALIYIIYNVVKVMKRPPVEAAANSMD